nr:PREDICTED: TBC domain-containing protein kinase-like protein isoform X2 [Bemisia tabaci]
MLSKEVAPKCIFGAMTFVARCHSGDSCGSNGLPLTPNSISILGRAQFLKTLDHPHLVKLLGVTRGKHERTIVVSEYFHQTLSDQGKLSLEDIVKFMRQILSALQYLHEKSIVTRCLAPDNILITDDGDIKLFNFGLYYMTHGGKSVSFPIGSPKYMAPEVFLHARSAEYTSGVKVDIWSLGIIAAELLLSKSLWDGVQLTQILRKVLSLVNCNAIFARLARECNKFDVYENIPPEIVDFVNQCLKISVHERPMASQLLEHPVFKIYPKKESIIEKVHCLNMVQERKHPLDERDLNEIYYLWQLSGGDVEGELKRRGLIKNKPPILCLPQIVLLEGQILGGEQDQSSMLDLRVAALSLNTLVQRLEPLPLTVYYPLIESSLQLTYASHVESDAAPLPLIIREKDIEYQFLRIMLMKRLIDAYPLKKSELIKEACKDIPPLYRGVIWAIILNVIGDVEPVYTEIDKETVTPTDRQIEVDIPRCHQYNELLSSKEGHLKLKRVLKAWVISHPEYVYWQGLDSLAAPFVYLNFSNESVAHACLSAFILKYLYNLFLKDNSEIIREYLAKFSHLISFQDPVLANHLDEIKFIPELFAIPWFLTMFSHVFPLHKILHLWDKLLLGDASFPLFIGLAILQQLRDTLLSSGFNECILLFSDLPEIDMERCVADSMEPYCTTPKSITFRQHEYTHQQSIKQRKNTSPLEMSGLSYTELQAEFCPRISAADLLDLMHHSPQRVLTVDIRPQYEFVEEAAPGSINIPFGTIDFGGADSDSSPLPPSPELSILYNNKGKVVIIIGEEAASAAKVLFANRWADY